MLAEIILAMTALVPTDQTVNVAKGTKLDVNNFAGDVIIKTWDKDAVRVEATHSDREIVDIKQGEQVLTIRSRSTRGDIKVVGGSGFVSLKSVQGEITLEKAKGRVEVRAVNEGIHLADISADLSAESTNGSIILDRIDSANVDLYALNGNISYDGAIKDKGLYRLTTHNGMIAMPVPEKANATITLRTYTGGIRSTFPLPGDPEDRRKKRMTLTLGNGSAHVELESFGGAISLRRPGEARPETERRRTREKEKDKDIGRLPFGDLDRLAIEADVARAMAEAQPEIDRALAEAQPEIDRAVNEAMREVGPEIDRAVNEAMAALKAVGVPHVMPMPNPMPMPRPRPLPRR